MYYEEKFIDGMLVWRNTPDGEWQTKLTEISQVANMVYRLTDEERMELFGYFCTHCGSTYKPCYCTRDE